VSVGQRGEISLESSRSHHRSISIKISFFSRKRGMFVKQQGAKRTAKRGVSIGGVGGAGLREVDIVSRGRGETRQKITQSLHLGAGPKWIH